MSCNCKEEAYNGVKKYSDDGGEILKPRNVFGIVLTFIFRLIYGIFLSAIVIIALPFVILYVVFASVFGKGVTVDIKKLFKLNGKK
jgi:hypothetical protein